MNDDATRRGGGIARAGAASLALATAAVHIYLFAIEGFLGNGKMLPIYQLLFVGNFFFYAALAAALLVPALRGALPFTRALLVAVATASFASYFYVGVLDTLGNVDKAIEVALVVLLAVDAGRSGWEEGVRSAGGPAGAALQIVAGILLGLLMFWALTPFMV